MSQTFRPALETFNAIGVAEIRDFRPFRPRPVGLLDTAGLNAAPGSNHSCNVHAECNMAVELLTATSAMRSEIEIGVSRYSCWLCVLFLSELAAATGIPIVISGHHSNVYCRWKFPDALPLELRDRIRLAMKRRLLNEVTQLVKTAHEVIGPISGPNSLQHPEYSNIYDDS